MRIHRSAIVRLDLIETLLRTEGSEYHVVMKGAPAFPSGDRAERRSNSDSAAFADQVRRSGIRRSSSLAVRRVESG